MFSLSVELRFKTFYFRRNLFSPISKLIIFNSVHRLHFVFESIIRLLSLSLSQTHAQSLAFSLSRTHSLFFSLSLSLIFFTWTSGERFLKFLSKISSISPSPLLARHVCSTSSSSESRGSSPRPFKLVPRSWTYQTGKMYFRRIPIFKFCLFWFTIIDRNYVNALASIFLWPCGQSYKHFTIINYDSRVVIWGIFQSGTTLHLKSLWQKSIKLIRQHYLPNSYACPIVIPYGV